MDVWPSLPAAAQSNDVNRDVVSHGLRTYNGALMRIPKFSDLFKIATNIPMIAYYVDVQVPETA
jgi:hypothetical protein